MSVAIKFHNHASSIIINRLGRVFNMSSDQDACSSIPIKTIIKDGQDGGTRTHDPKTPSLVRYQLRHILIKVVYLYFYFFKQIFISISHAFDSFGTFDRKSTQNNLEDKNSLEIIFIK